MCLELAALGVLNDFGDLDRVQVIATRQHIESKQRVRQNVGGGKRSGSSEATRWLYGPPNLRNYSNA
jgi:hypothetical protein